jgi:hypothetical protein
VVGHGDHPEPGAARFEHGGSAGLVEIHAGANPRKPSRLEVGERVEETVRPEVERVVVRKRDAIHAQAGERLGGRHRRPKAEDLPGSGRSALGDAALEVEQAEIGLAEGGDELGREERVRPVGHNPLGDASAKHRVAGERELHGAKPCLP